MSLRCHLCATQCEEYELLLPIPQQELSFNMYITQNPGY
ncbi:MAG: RagB/SusD family nutrient uptake outer membrane protein [Prevotella sp.]|nr:RagB/SusD family nutrient uptake outer membrane protein [Prevotella sp.]